VQPLQHHHHRYDPRRHRITADHREQVGEFLVREKTMALARQQALDRFWPSRASRLRASSGADSS